MNLRFYKLIIFGFILLICHQARGQITRFDISATSAIPEVDMGRPKYTVGVGDPNLQLQIEKFPRDDAESFMLEGFDTSIISVSSTFEVTALKNGETSIRVVSNSGAVESFIDIEVKNVDVISILLSTEGGVTQNISQRSGTLQLKVDVNPVNATNREVTYSIIKNEDGVGVTIDSNTGLLRATNRGNGVIDVRATSKQNPSVTNDLQVTISGQDLATVIVNQLKVTTDKISVTEGETNKINVEVLPADATDKRLRFLTTSPKVCTVDEVGNVSTITDGNCSIRITALDTETVTEFSIFTVKRIFVPGQLQDFLLKPDLNSLKTGQSLAIGTDFIPNDSPNKNLEWSVDDPSIISVTQDGIVTGLKEGRANVTAKSLDGSNIEKSVFLQVFNDPQWVSLNSASIHPQISQAVVNQSVIFEPITFPSDANNQNVIWTSSDETIMTIVPSPISLFNTPRAVTTQFNRAGTVTLSMKTMDGSNIEDSITITVGAGTSTPISSIEINYPSLEVFTEVKSTPTITIKPENATNKSLRFVSEDTDILTVEQTGVVKGISFGTATLTIETTDGTNITKNFQFSVTPNPNIGPGSVTALEFENVVEKNNVYPNPSGRMIFLKNRDDLKNIKVYNSNGQVHMQLDQFPVDGLQIKSLKPGLYYIQALKNQKINIFPFVKK